MNDQGRPRVNLPTKKEKYSKGRYRFNRSRKKQKKDLMQQIALERVDILFTRALEIYAKDTELANHYVDLANRIRMVARIRLPERWRVYICRGCKKIVICGINCRVREQSRPGKGSRVVKTCLNCGRITRYNLKIAEELSEVK